MSRNSIKVCLAILAIPPLLMLLGMAGLFGYLPTKAAVAREFERRHASWQVADVTVVGGDEDGCTYSIRYRKPPGPEHHYARWSVYCSGVIFGWNVRGETLDLPAKAQPRRQ